MSPPPRSEPEHPLRWWLLAGILCALLAAWVSDPAWRQPGTSLLCNVVHPDCAGNYWLLEWVTRQVTEGAGLAHNDRYYWPVGDAPFLAGNGGEGLLAVPLSWLLAWPLHANALLLLLLWGNGMAAVRAARSVGAGWPGSLLAGSVVLQGAYPLQALSSGRFTQFDLVWMLLFLGSWFRFLEHPTRRRALGAAVLLAITAALYWYYGFFMVLAGGLALLLRRLQGPVPLAPLAWFAGLTAVLLAFPLAWFLGGYTGIPGVAEAFPHPEAIRDSLDPAWPFLVREGRFVVQALPATVVLLALFQGLRALRARIRGETGGLRLDLTLVGIWTLFFALALGPRFELAGLSPFEAIYGLAAPLQRFWWPSRHIALASIALALLAARSLPAPRWGPAAVLAGVGLFATTPLLLRLQGLDLTARVTEMTWPPPPYREMRDLPGEILLELPLSPEVAVSQRHLLYQLAHEKTLLTGHALWVDRVRPPRWDAFVAGNSFLSGLQAVEEGRAGGTFSYEPADLDALVEAGLGVVVLNAEHYPFPLRGAWQAEKELLEALFGSPAARDRRLWAWTTGQRSSETHIEIPDWSWPPGFRGREGSVPTVLATPHSPFLEPPSRRWSVSGDPPPGP